MAVLASQAGRRRFEPGRPLQFNINKLQCIFNILIIQKITFPYTIPYKQARKKGGVRRVLAYHARGALVKNHAGSVYFHYCH